MTKGANGETVEFLRLTETCFVAGLALVEVSCGPVR